MSTQFGNATYAITDGTSTLSIYRGYGLNGDKFTSAEQIKVGAEVEVYGTLVNYMGNTPQMTTGSKLIQLRRRHHASRPARRRRRTCRARRRDNHLRQIAHSSGKHDNRRLHHHRRARQRLHSAIAPRKLGCSTHLCRQHRNHQRSGDSEIVFNIASTNKFRYTTFTPNTGTLSPAQASGDTSVTWLGNATSVTFTVGHDATLGSDGASKRGQIHISDIVIYPAK